MTSDSEIVAAIRQTLSEARAACDRLDKLLAESKVPPMVVCGAARTIDRNAHELENTADYIEQVLRDGEGRKK